MGWGEEEVSEDDATRSRRDVPDETKALDAASSLPPTLRLGITIFESTYEECTRVFLATATRATPAALTFDARGGDELPYPSLVRSQRRRARRARLLDVSPPGEPVARAG